MIGTSTILSAVMLQAAAPPSAPASRVLSLEQATTTAIANQPQLRQAHFQSDAAAARADEARAPLFPQVTANATYQRSTANFAPRPGSLPTQVSTANQRSSWDTFDYWNFGITANQLIYDFGQTTGRWRAAQASAESQQQTERSTRLQTVLNVRTAYFQARAQKAMIQVARDTLANQDRHLEQIKGFVELGSRPAIDLAQARTDVANAKVQLISAENAYATAKAQLNQAMGTAQGTDYDVADDALPAIAEEDQGTEPLVQTALGSRPELVALAKQIQAQEQLLRSARANYGPTLGASTGFTDAGRQLNDLRWNWNASVTLSWQLFQGMVVPAQVREAEANLAAAKAQRQSIEQQLRLEVEQARLAVRASKATLAAIDEALTNSKQRLRLAEGRYQTGAGSVIELADAQLAAANAAAQRVAADYNLASARAQLVKALGRE